MQVLLTAKAEADILGVVEYYESFEASSLPFRLSIAEAITHLEAFPETAVRRRDLTRRDVFFWLVNPYWIVLRRTEGLMFIVSVHHCALEPGPILHERLKDF